MSTTTTPHHGPYAPSNWSLGSPASVHDDIAPSAIFLVFFLICLAIDIIISRRNAYAGIKFRLSIPLLSFSLIRIISAILRIVLACYPHHVPLAIAANIFVVAGVVVFYIINFFFVQRLVRAALPTIGWTKAMALFPIVGIAVTVSTLLMLIVTLIQQFYTRDVEILHIDRTISLVGSTINLVLAFLPIPLLGLTLCVLLYRRLANKSTRIETIGTSGTFAQKILFLLFVSALLTLGTGFRAGTAWVAPVSVTKEKPWYFSKACFYVFDLGLDAVILMAYLVLRVDKLFWVPDGCVRQGQYEVGCAEARKLGFASSEMAEKEIV